MTFEEINKTLTDEEAKKEVSRCLKCSRPLCKMKGCPAELRINEFMKAFLMEMKKKHIELFALEAIFH